MSEYAKNIQTIEDMRKKRIELPEVVRCMDCKHFEPDGEPSEVYPNSYWCDKLTVYMPPDGFCSFGKRKVVSE